MVFRPFSSVSGLADIRECVGHSAMKETGTASRLRKPSSAEVGFVKQKF